MNTNKYTIRRAESQADAKKLNNLFTAIFHPEDVGTFAEILFLNHPGSGHKYWYIVEDKESAKIVSAFTLINWNWEFEGVPLKVAELGIVGTLEEHRGQGLIKALNREFEKTLEEEQYDLTGIQGIPGYYHRLGYHYAITMENHINVPFYVIKENENPQFTFRLADKNDIPYLIEQDRIYRDSYSISVQRDQKVWEYLFEYSPKTEYGSEFWIMEGSDEKYYFRVPGFGFGKGLIVSEISESISPNGMNELLTFCKTKAVERGKPYIRLNVSNDTAPGRLAISLGSEKGNPYAWQMKIPNTAQFLKTISPVLEKRVADSPFRGLSEPVIIDYYNRRFLIRWENGKIQGIEIPEVECKARYTIRINDYLFPALCLGHRTWRELGNLSPDIYFHNSGEVGVLIDTLFPKTVSWIHEQY